MTHLGLSILLLRTDFVATLKDEDRAIMGAPLIMPMRRNSTAWLTAIRLCLLASCRRNAMRLKPYLCNSLTGSLGLSL